jgi:pimeloyl-ACP methyl ester carboxylesterase
MPASELQRSADVSIHFQDQGAGPAVVLLHGFPDCIDVWRHQIPVLVDAGFRVIAPDLRGFGESSRPARVEDYKLGDLLGDVVALLDSLGLGRGHVVGHDWGAVLAWGLGALHPGRVDHLVALSVGHPSSMRGAGLEQRQKSWYQLLFQFEGIAEEWCSANGYANLRGFIEHPDIERVVDGLARPGALTASLNWYRANVPPSSLIAPVVELPPVAAPTMGVWSSEDIAVIERAMRDSGEYVTGEWRYERIEGASHWMALDAPDELNALLLDFLPAP